MRGTEADWAGGAPEPAVSRIGVSRGVSVSVQTRTDRGRTLRDRDVLNRALIEFADTLIQGYGASVLLKELSERVAEVLSVDGAGVSLADDKGVLCFVTATDPRTGRLCALQLGSGQGPCWGAYATGEPVFAADLRTVDQWPKFAGAAVEAGVLAAAGVPMPIEGQTIGVLNLYTTTPTEWADEPLTAARALVGMATAYVLNVRRAERSQRLADQLQHALYSRVVIEQAKGMLAERLHMDVNDTFELLRRHARNHSERLDDVAAAVVNGTLRLAEDT